MKQRESGQITAGDMVKFKARNGQSHAALVVRIDNFEKHPVLDGLHQGAIYLYPPREGQHVETSVYNERYDTFRSADWVRLEGDLVVEKIPLGYKSIKKINLDNEECLPKSEGIKFEVSIQEV